MTDSYLKSIRSDLALFKLAARIWHFVELSTLLAVVVMPEDAVLPCVLLLCFISLYFVFKLLFFSATVAMSIWIPCLTCCTIFPHISPCFCTFFLVLPVLMHPPSKCYQTFHFILCPGNIVLYFHFFHPLPHVHTTWPCGFERPHRVASDVIGGLKSDMSR